MTKINDEDNSDAELNGQPAPEQETPETKPAKEPAKTPPPRQPVAVTITDIELEQLKKDAAEAKDKYLRLLAEQENMRKRLQKDKEQMTQYAIQNVITDFIEPIDHFENALKFTEQMSDEVKTWGHGFQMILTQFKDVLSQNGVVPVYSLGKPFDPHIHEAIETVETEEYPPGTIVEESLKGYKIGDRTIRPSRVKVSKAPSKTEQK